MYAFQKLTRSISKGNNLLIYKLLDCICSVLFLALTLLCFYLDLGQQYMYTIFT